MPAALILAAALALSPEAAALNAAVKPVEVRALASPYAEAHTLKAAGIARTSVERRGDAATAALGFLCGLQEGKGRTGAAAAPGSDPHGRFLGAKLSFAFR